MKTAIISDIHGNLDALDAVLDDAQKQGVTNFLCLGDIVGYGPNPVECVVRIQELKCICVQGNHDQYASSDFPLDKINDMAASSIAWTREQLNNSHKTWLAELPIRRRIGRNDIVHASPANPELFDYIRNRFDATVAMISQSAPLCFIGHTHTPVVYAKDNEGVRKIEANGSELIIASSKQYLINVGSVGQPRDGNPDACYVIFDRTAKHLTFRRVEYDVATVQKKIFAMGLDPRLADRLNAVA